MSPRRPTRYDSKAREAALAFDALVFRALDKDTAPLVEYLLSSDPLTDRHRSGLAWLIERALGPKPRGRKPGRVRSTLHDAGYEARKIVRRLRVEELAKAPGRQRLSPGTLDELIKEAITLVEEKMPQCKGMLTDDYIRDLLKR